MDPNMSTSVKRQPVALTAVAALGLLATSGCETKPAYQPPTASVNGGPAAIAASTDAADATPGAHAPSGATGAAATDGHADQDAGNKVKPAPLRPEYFVGWPKPKLALVFSGRQDGYIEPCGCAGLENQKGGLNRRHAFLQQLAERGWPVAAVDVGGQVRRFGHQAEVQFTLVADALKKMGYGAIGLGTADLRLSAGHILSSVTGADQDDTVFVSANVSLFGLTPKVRIIEAGGMKIGVTAILGKEYQQRVNNDEVEVRPAAEALADVVPQLADCDVRILLAHATTDESQELARRFPQFTFVVTADGADEPPAQPELIAGTRTRLVEVGHKGMYVVVAGFYDDPKQPVRFQRVGLDARYPDTAEMKQLMVTYQDQLQQLGWEGLGIRDVPHPQTKPGNPLSGKFVGTAECKDCHEAAWDVWANSKHAHATDTLVHLDPPRQYDAECVSCHATGWNPQEYFPYTSGFLGLDKTPHLTGNGCENCHGPGAAHVAAENGEADDAQRDALRASMHLTWNEAKTDTCVKCHDLDNSPEFSGNVEHYWSEIAH
jgi:hypothetical protein